MTSISGTNHSDIQVVDLDGHVAVPGFIDSHLHLTYGASGLGDIDLSTATCKDDFITILAKASSQLSVNSWIAASGWSEQNLGEIPDKSWLDDFGDTPIICYSMDLHTAVINEPVIALLDMKRVSLMPGSEHIELGLVKEDALFEGIVQYFQRLTDNQKLHEREWPFEKCTSKELPLLGQWRQQMLSNMCCSSWRKKNA